MTDGLFYPAQIQRIPAGSHNIFVINRNDEATIVMAPLELRLFDLLSGCLPLGHHAARLLESDVPGMNRQWAQQLVQEWMTNGLLRPFQFSIPDSEEGISASGSVTQGSPVTFTSDESLLPMILDRTGAAGIPEDVVRFALENSGADMTGGAHQNAAILLSDEETVLFPPTRGILRTMRADANRPFESLDDLETIALDGPSGFPEMPLRDLESVERSTVMLPEQRLLSVSGRLLGTPVLEHLDRLDFEYAPPELLRVMERFNPRIRCVCTGLFGNRTSSMPYAWLCGHNGVRPGLGYGDPGVYRETREANAMISHPEQITLSGSCPPTGAIAAMCLGEGSFPFFPLSPPDSPQSIGITEALFRTRFLNDAVLTVPAATERSTTNDVETALDYSTYFENIETRLLLVTRHMVARLLHRSGPQRMRELASRFQRLSSLPPARMEDHYDRLKKHHCSNLIKRLGGLMRFQDSSSLLVEDAKHAITLLEKERDTPLQPESVYQEHYREVFRLWGGLLYWWPSIVEATRLPGGQNTAG